jgi:signal peptidase I
MSLAGVQLALTVTALLSLAVQGAFVWLGARVARVPDVGYLRSLVGALLLQLLGFGALAAAYWFGGAPPAPGEPDAAHLVFLRAARIALIAFGLGGIALTLALRASLLQGYLTLVIATVLSGIYSIGVVLILRAAVCEAFVIPTGAMADTLLGYHRDVTCPQCGFRFPVNCANEVDPQHGPSVPVTGCTCPNCRFHINWPDPTTRPDWSGGDRVLFGKYSPVGRTTLGEADRHGLILFRYPEEESKGILYVKRLVGLPEETVAIFNGDLYVGRVDYPEDGDHPRPPWPADRWKPEYTYPNDPAALTALRNGEFRIVRKPPAAVLAMRRIVHDNDFPAADLAKPELQRWVAEAVGGWRPDNPAAARAFEHPGGPGGLSWLRYRHLIVPEERRAAEGGGPRRTPPRTDHELHGLQQRRTEARRAG